MPTMIVTFKSMPDEKIRSIELQIPNYSTAADREIALKEAKLDGTFLKYTIPPSPTEVTLEQHSQWLKDEKE